MCTALVLFLNATFELRAFLILINQDWLHWVEFGGRRISFGKGTSPSLSLAYAAFSIALGWFVFPRRPNGQPELEIEPEREA